jgi:diguanylate cyclase (GGDEF)-like protein/PAS domain S-box-containing protein
MKKLSLNLKILIIFFIPAIALVYFSFSFVELKYKKIDESLMYKLTAKITDTMSKLVHNIQIERGLSAGYIVAKDTQKYKNQLLSQYKKTDESFKNFLTFLELKSHAKDMIVDKLGYINTPLVKKVLLRLKYKDNIRKNVLNHSITFDKEIEYYTNLNTNLLKSIKSFIILLKKQNNDNNALSKLQELKEYAGLERAYIYHQLLLKKFDDKSFQKIKELQIKQDTDQEAFILEASIESLQIYNNNLNLSTEFTLMQLRKKYEQKQLSSKDADFWFNTTTQRIDDLEKISSEILKKYIHISNQVHNKAINSLYITAVLWILSIISLAILSYILKNLIQNEESLIEELRISAYTFDSHEAMTITDVNGTIIKVNDAFTRITGYSREEVIGKNPRVLKSMKHDDEFYKEMWRQLHTVGKWSDDIYNKRKNGEIYLERLSITAIKDEKDIITHYIAQFLDISDVKKAQEIAQHQADHDFLTGLLNRKALIQRLNEEFVKARRHNFLHAFLFLDLDEFKNVNDTYGHNTGDKLLVEISNRLKQLLREEDILARISGDEFAIIILNIDENEAEAAKDISKLATKIIDALNQVFILGEYKIKIGASIGIKLFPDAEKDVASVIIHADTAMYQAKAQGKNQFVFFNKETELKLRHFKLLEDELIQAYKNNEFKFYYQPKIDVKTSKLVGAESLIRWQHPQKGLLSPDSFMDVLIDIGMLHKITLLALNDACLFLKDLKESPLQNISLNINSIEILNDAFEDNIIKTIQKHNIDASKIELEITENELIKDFDTTILKINKLKKFGIRFAIDDFGSGYSSITYLQKLPVNSIKIDKSFLINLSDTSNQEILKMIIDMASIFGMSSVVEGIETKEQLEIIKKYNADLYQGFLFSKALDEDEFKKLLNS